MLSKRINISLLTSSSTQSQYIHMNSTTDTITVMSFAICKACSWGWCSVAEGQAKANRGVFLIWLLTYCCYRVNTETCCSVNQKGPVFFSHWLNMWMTLMKVYVSFTFLKLCWTLQVFKYLTVGFVFFKETLESVGFTSKNIFYSWLYLLKILVE